MPHPHKDQDDSGIESLERRLRARLEAAGVRDARQALRRLNEAREAGVLAALRSIKDLRSSSVVASGGVDGDSRDGRSSIVSAADQEVLSRLGDVRDRLVDAEAKRAAERHKWRHWKRTVNKQLAEMNSAGLPEQVGPTVWQMIAVGATVAAVSVLLALTVTYAVSTGMAG